MTQTADAGQLGRFGIRSACRAIGEPSAAGSVVSYASPWRWTWVLLVLIVGGPVSQAWCEERQVGSFSLSDVHGKLHQPSEWQGAKAVVLLFLGTECPISNGYAPEMSRLAAQFGPRGVLFYGVHCDADVTAATAAAHAKDYGLGFPLLLDPRQVLPERTGATVTPEAVVLRPAGVVLYRGRIDNRYTPQGKRRLEPTVKDLEAALDAVLAGRAPPAAETEAVGCPIPRSNRQ